MGNAARLARPDSVAGVATDAAQFVAASLPG
jgi:hypothetical protein